jgi:hypothetical protein
MCLVGVDLGSQLVGWKDVCTLKQSTDRIGLVGRECFIIV